MTKRYALRLVLTFLRSAGLGLLAALVALYLTERLTGAVYMVSMVALAAAVFFAWRYSGYGIDLIDPRD